MEGLEKIRRAANDETIRRMRGDMDDPDWYAYLVRIASTQEDILNRHVEAEGPEGVEFEVRVKDKGVGWAKVKDVLSAIGGPFV